MNAKTIDDALDAVSRLQGYGLLAYELVESVIRDGGSEDADTAAMVIHDGISDACDELKAILKSIEPHKPEPGDSPA